MSLKEKDALENFERVNPFETLERELTGLYETFSMLSEEAAVGGW